MPWRSLRATLLCATLALFQVLAQAQVPIIDASEPRAGSRQPAREAPQPVPAGEGQGELFFQLQMLQQEVMELRGLVEQQGHVLRELRQQSLDRYIELDRRLGGEPARGGQGAALPPLEPEGAAPISGRGQSQEGEHDAYKEAYARVRAQDFPAAVDAFKDFLERYPNGQFAANAHYWLGELYLVLTPPQVDDAIAAFQLLLDQYPRNNKVPDALYKLGRAWHSQGDNGRALQALDQVIDNHRGSTAARLARQYRDQHF